MIPQKKLLPNGKLSQKKKDILLSILENAKKEKEGDQETSSVGSESDHSSEDPFDVSEVVAKNKEIPNLTLVNDAPDTSVIFMSPEEQREGTLLESSEPDGIREIQLKNKFYEHYNDLFHGTEESSKR